MKVEERFTMEKEREIRSEAFERLGTIRKLRWNLAKKLSEELALQGGGFECELYKQLEELTWSIENVPDATTPVEYVDTIIKLADITETDIFYEPGCGEGNILCNVVKKTECKGIGVEIDSYLLNKGLRLARQLAIEERIKLIHDDYYNPSIQDEISEATVVYLFLTSGVLSVLKPQLLSFLENGTRIISHLYSISRLEAIKQIDEPTRFYLYSR